MVVQESEGEQPDAEPQGEAAAIEAEPQPEAPVMLGEADVSALIPEHLPEQTRTRLLAGEYASPEAVKEAVIREVEYLKAVTGAGRPIGVRSEKPAPVSLDEAGKEAEARFDSVNSKWFGR